jgi:hypothetical protein
MNKFDITHTEIIAAYGDSAKHFKRTKQYARIYPYPHKDVKYSEEVILEVVSIDNNFSQSAIVRNPNEFEWITKLSRLRYCDINGKKLS